MRKRVLIAGYYGYGNLGDEAILQCMIHDLRAKTPDLEITAVSGNPALTKSIHGVNALATHEFTQVVHAAQETDLIILGGGGLFHDYQDFDPDTLLTRNYSVIAWYSTYAFIATLLEKPFMLYAVGVGPLFSEHAKMYTLAAFEQAAAITVRDEGSRNLMIALGIAPEKIQTVNDPVLGMSIPKADLSKHPATQGILAKDKPSVAVALRHWPYSPVAESRWLTQIAQALDQFIETHDANVIFIPFHEVDWDSNNIFNDSSIGAALATTMQHRERLTTLSSGRSVEDVAGIIGGCDLVLGMRLHSLILGANSEVPLVGLAYDPKVRELMQQLGMDVFMADLANIDSDTLFRMLDIAYTSRVQIADILRSKVASLTAPRYRSAELAAALLHSGGSLVPMSAMTLQLMKRALLWFTTNYDLAQVNISTLTGTLAEKAQEAAQGELFAMKEEQFRQRETQLLSQVEEHKTAVDQMREQIRSSQSEKEARHSQYLALQNQYETLKHDCEQIVETANRMQATRAWKLATIYWKNRDRTKRSARRFFSTVYRGLRRLYHLSVPLGTRLKLRDARWKLRGYRLVAEATAPDLTRAVPTRNDQPCIVVFATVPYYDIGGGQRSAQLAKTFARMGYYVLYFYASESSDRSAAHATLIPTAVHAHIADTNPRRLIQQVGASPVFIFEAPHPLFEPYLNLANVIGVPVVYEHIDNWATELGNEFFNIQILKKFIQQATLMIATSRMLHRQIMDTAADAPELQARMDRLVYSPNAVDIDLFDPVYAQPRPVDLVTGVPTIIYYGSLWGEWIDWTLLKTFAEGLPNAAINLIGDYATVQMKMHEMPENITFLGLKRQIELPAYLAHSDIALIPFRGDAISPYVSPLKVFEYIAMGKPVLASHLPDIEGYPGVFNTNLVSEWIEFGAGEYKTRVDSTHRVHEQQTFALENSWYARCNTLLSELQSRAQAQRLSIVILNRNNINIIFKCVNSLIQFCAPYGYEIIVVDNQSSDGSCELLELDSRITLIRNAVNGCASGRNLGVQHSTGDLIVFVDSDQWVVSTGWLDVGMNILDKYRHIGAVGRNAGWFEPEKVTGPISMYFPNEGMTPDQVFRTDIAFLATSGLIIRRTLFNAIGGFDTAYDPTCYEDTDLSLKIRDAGFDLAYTARLGINHLPHQSTKSGSPAHIALMERNGTYFQQKWKHKNAALLKCYVTEGFTVEKQ